jgi:hypothetical protein
MFSWLRRIRVRGIKILGLELEFDHHHETASFSPQQRKAPSVRDGRSLAAPPGATFTIHGPVIQTKGNDLGIRVRNEAELRAFWRDNQIDTKLDWFGPGAPVISIGRKADIQSCRIGDEARLTFVVEDRADGKRGIKTVKFSGGSRA